MFSIFLRTLKVRRVSLLIYTGASALFMWMYIAMFPTILDQSEQMSELIQNYPEGLLEAFGISADQFGFDTIEQFVSLEHFSIIWPLVVMFMVVGFAGYAISRDIEDGTIEHLLAKPVSRLKVFFGRYLAGLAALVLFTFASIYVAIPLSALHGVDYAAPAYWYMSVLGVLFGWAIFSVAMMFSALFSERSRVYMFTGGLLLVMYVANIASALIDSLEKFQYISFFHYFDYHAALVNQEINVTSAVVFAVVAIICTAVGAIWFNRRDIAV